MHLEYLNPKVRGEHGEYPKTETGQTLKMALEFGQRYMALLNRRPLSKLARSLQNSFSPVFLGMIQSSPVWQTHGLGRSKDGRWCGALPLLLAQNQSKGAFRRGELRCQLYWGLCPSTIAAQLASNGTYQESSAATLKMQFRTSSQWYHCSLDNEESKACREGEMKNQGCLMCIKAIVCRVFL